MVKGKNSAVVFKYILSILLALLSLQVVYFYLASDYPGLITDLLKSTGRSGELQRALHNAQWIAAYQTAKPMLAIVLFGVFGFLYDASFRPGGKPARWMETITKGMLSVWTTNREYWRKLSPLIRRGLIFVGALQVFFYLLFLLNLPFTYDEAFSYNNFSGKGLAACAFFYPSADNHILYNLAARVFVFLPLSPQISTRLPAFISSFIASWYFFKLASRHFTPALSLFLLVLFAGSFPVVLSGCEARGYGFLTTCTILLLYAADHFTEPAGQRKYVALYVLASIAGLYTIPSFIIAIFPLVLGIILYLWIRRHRKALRRFIIGQQIVVIAILVLYFPVILVNPPGVLFRQGASDLQPFAERVRQMGPALTEAWNFLLGNSNIPLSFIFLPLLATFLFALTYRERSRLLFCLVLVMLISSPFLFLFLPNRPGTLTWTFLIVPLILSLGCAGTGIVVAAARITPDWVRLPAVILTCCCGTLLLLFVNFKQEHNRWFAIDYLINDDLRKMGSNIDRVRTIGITGGPWEFYVAEDVYFKRISRNPDREIGVNNSQYRYNREDVLILQPDSTSHIDLAGYLLIGEHPARYSMYQRVIPDTTAMH